MSEEEKKGPMKDSAYAIEPGLKEEIESTMGDPDMAASERYRILTIIGLDEYAISGSELRKKRFPIKGELCKSFTVMLPVPVIGEIGEVKKKRNQTKRLAIRYIVLLGFEKWKKDQEANQVEEVSVETGIIVTHTEPAIGEKFQAIIDLINEHDLKITIEKK